MFTSRHFLARAYRSTTTRRAAMSTHTNNGTTKAKTMSIPLSRIQKHAHAQQQQQQGAKIITLLLGMGAAAITTSKVMNDTSYNTKAQCAASSSYKSGGDVVMLGPTTQEKSTGIMFPHLCNGMQFVGCGVRIKYGFVKVYAVGTYMDPIAMSAIKTHGNTTAIEQALLDPSYPRTIRIVMNRGLSIEKYTAAIVEALSPRMNGIDLEKLEEFKALNPPVDLVEGAEMEMTIRGNVMLYKNSLGGVGQIESKAFCTALCDVYYGTDPVSPGHKEMVVKGVQNL